MATTPADKTAIVVMGVSSSGKSTVAKILADRLGWPMAEGDDFHSAANKSKMESGTPLTDADRMPWLESIRDWISEAEGDVLVTCSALRRKYRDVLRGADARVRFLHLHGSREELAERMGERKDHFMPLKLLDSQLETLEQLDPDEDGVKISIEPPTEEIADAGLEALALRPR